MMLAGEIGGVDELLSLRGAPLFAAARDTSYASVP
jgi:hypothetical protein